MPLTLSGSGGITYPDGSVNTTRSVSVAGDTMTGPLNLANNSRVGSSSYAALAIGGNSTSSDWHIVRDASAFNIYTGAIGSGTLRFGVSTAGTVNVPNGQIQFPVAQNASSNANTLDDYEEGTWTPSSVVNQNGTPVTWYNNGGTYTKIGRFAFVKFRVQVAPSSGTEIRIYGIPFGSVDGDTGHGTSLATRTSTNHTVVINTDHIWLQGTNNYEYLYGMVIYQTN